MGIARDDQEFIDRVAKATRVLLVQTGPLSCSPGSVIAHEIAVITVPAQPDGAPAPSTEILPADPLRVLALVQTDSNALFLLSGPQAVPNVTTDGYAMVYGWSGFSPFPITSQESVHVAQAPATETPCTVRVWIERRVP